jgi:excisionase family DNA binding protein
MIDIATETIITLEEAAERLLVTKSSVYSLVTRGSRGIKLEAFRVGGRWRTSAEALQRFVNAQTPSQEPNPEPNYQRSRTPAVRTPTSSERQRHLEAVSRELDEMMGVRFCARCDARIEWLKGSVPKDGLVWCPKCLVTRKSATLGQRVRTFRCAAFLSQRALANRTGIGVDIIRAYEYDQRTPSDAHLAKLIEVLGAELVIGLAGNPQHGPETAET